MVIQRARALLGDGDDPLHSLVEGLEVEWRRLAEERAALASEIAEAAKARGEAEARREAASLEAEEFSRRAHQQVEGAVSGARAEIGRLLREFRSAESRERAVQVVRMRLTELERQAGEVLGDVADREHPSGFPSAVQTGSPQAPGAASIRHGQQVRIKGLDQQGTVIGTLTSAGLVEVQLPLGRVRLPVKALIVEEYAHRGEAVPLVQVTRAIEEASSELNLIGCDAEEAARRLDRYVGDAFLAGLPTLRVIHGKGGGILRRTVAELLQNHPLVSSFRLADYREGGIGVTIIELHSHGGRLGGAE